MSKPMEVQSHPAHLVLKNTTINILSTADGTTPGRQCYHHEGMQSAASGYLGSSTRTSNASKGETDIACPLIYVPMRSAASATTPSGKTLLPEDKHQSYSRFWVSSTTAAGIVIGRILSTGLRMRALSTKSSLQHKTISARPAPIKPGRARQATSGVLSFGCIVPGDRVQDPQAPTRREAFGVRGRNSTIDSKRGAGNPSVAVHRSRALPPSSIFWWGCRWLAVPRALFPQLWTSDFRATALCFVRTHK